MVGRLYLGGHLPMYLPNLDFACQTTKEAAEPKPTLFHKFNYFDLFIICFFAMAAEGGNIVRYIYRGEEGERIPDNATHVTVHEDATAVLNRAFEDHRNIVEIICHIDVGEIEEEAFYCCKSLRRAIMPGVEIVGMAAFCECDDLADVECGKLKRIGGYAFGFCESLRSIDLPSARNVGLCAFTKCYELRGVRFGKNLETIEGRAFGRTSSLERITIPLKDGMITDDSIFTRRDQLNHVDLVEGSVLQKTIADLQLEVWRNDMNEEIDSINQILPSASNGYYPDYEVEGDEDLVPGENALEIRRWIRSVLAKIVHYKAEHRGVLDEAVTTLQHALPRDILMNSILPYLELPSHAFEGENDEVESDGDDFDIIHG